LQIKTVLLVIALAGFISLYGDGMRYAYAQESRDAADSFKYRNTCYHITIDYPENWKMQSGDDCEDFPTFAIFDDTSKIGAFEIKVIKRPYPEEIEDYDALSLYTNDKINQVESNEDMKLITATSLKKNSMTIYYIEGILEGTESTQITETFVFENRNLYTFKHSEKYTEDFIERSHGFIAKNVSIGAYDSYRSQPINYVAVKMDLSNTPSDIAIDNISQDKILYIANEISNSVSIVDIQKHKVIGEIDVGQSPTGIAFDTYYNLVYVANAGSDTISIIDGVSRKVINTLEVDDMPTDIVIDQLNSLVFVVNSGSNSVTIIGDSSVLAAISVGESPTQMAINPILHKVYVTNYDGNSVSVIPYHPNALNYDQTSMESIVIQDEVKTVKTGPNPVGIAVDPFSNYVYVANSNMDDTTSTQGSISTINGITDEVIPELEVSIENPTIVVFNRNTNLIYLSTLGGDIYELSTLAPIGERDVKIMQDISLPFFIRDMVVDPSQDRLYIISDDYPYSGLYEIRADGTSPMANLVNVHYQIKIDDNDVPADLKNISLKCNGEDIEFRDNISSGSHKKYEYGTQISCEVEDFKIIPPFKLIDFESFSYKNEKGVEISTTEATQDLEVTANFNSIPVDILGAAGSAIASLAGIYKFVPNFRKKMRGIVTRFTSTRRKNDTSS
jgi:YVTN family beta-propeller protein